MKRRSTTLLILLGLVAFGALTVWYLRKYPIPVLHPVGTIGIKERNLIAFTALLSIAVIVPVFSLLAVFAWRYREGNPKAKYTPELEGSRTAETIWWAIPTFIMIIISIVTWQSSYALDPYKPLVSNKQTIRIQVVALDWKWLFIYPDYGIASINEAALPVGTPANFSITSDSVMSSFWAPALGGQMYAMTGMSTTLHLDALTAGEYNGAAANISGKGFSGMRFVVKVQSDADFENWIAHARQAQSVLSDTSYKDITRPTENNKPEYFRLTDHNLYDTILMKYMIPEHTHNTNADGVHE